YLFHVLSHQAKLRDALRVKFLLVVEGYRFECKDRFAGFVHRLDGFLKAFRRGDRAKVARAINDYRYAVGNCSPINPGDKCFSLCPGRADADGFRLVSTSVDDIDIVVARPEIVPGSMAQCEVAVAI